MKKILIIDDDNFKKENIVNLLNKLNKKYELIVATALNPGLCKLSEDKYDLVLLDMSLPVFDLSEPDNFESYGGLIFLKEMKRKRINTPTIIITQYEIFGEGSKQLTSDAIDELCKKDFQNYLGLIIYSSSKSEWKEKLVKMLGDI